MYHVIHISVIYYFKNEFFALLNKVYLNVTIYTLSKCFVLLRRILFCFVSVLSLKLQRYLFSETNVNKIFSSFQVPDRSYRIILRVFQLFSVSVQHLSVYFSLTDLKMMLSVSISRSTSLT